MPELPEVETVRRGLQPVMEGAKIVQAEARRKNLRFPFQKDFSARLNGQTVTGLGRRAKYLLADLASGDVLLMHLGMSGSFRIRKPGEEDTPGQFHHPRDKDEAHDHVVFHMSGGTEVVFNDPRRFGYMKIIARHAMDEEPLLQGLGPEPLGNAFDAEMLARSCANKKTSLKAALLDPARRRGSRQYLCLRGAVPRTPVAASAGCDVGHEGRTTQGRCRGRTDRSRQAPGGGDPRGAERSDQGRRLILARSPPGLGRARLFSAFVPGL